VVAGNFAGNISVAGTAVIDSTLTVGKDVLVTSNADDSLGVRLENPSGVGYHLSFRNRAGAAYGTAEGEINWYRAATKTWALGEDIATGPSSYFALWDGVADDSTASADILSISHRGAGTGGGPKFLFGTRVGSGENNNAMFTILNNQPIGLRIQRQSDPALDADSATGGIEAQIYGDVSGINIYQTKPNYTRSVVQFTDAVASRWVIGNDYGLTGRQLFTMYNYSTASHVFAMDSSGRLGLGGQDNPAVTLDVTGDIHSTTKMTIGQASMTARPLTIGHATVPALGFNVNTVEKWVLYSLSDGKFYFEPPAGGARLVLNTTESTFRDDLALDSTLQFKLISTPLAPPAGYSGLWAAETDSLPWWTVPGGASYPLYNDTTGGGSGITVLNGLSGTSQSFAIGGSGAAPSWNSTGTTHTLNLPIATTNDTLSTVGLVDTVAQNFKGVKTFEDSVYFNGGTDLPDSSVMASQNYVLTRTDALQDSIDGHTNILIDLRDDTLAAVRAEVIHWSDTGTVATQNWVGENAYQPEDTASILVTQNRTITLEGTGNEVTVSGGEQNLSANRIWTLGMASDPIFPGSGAMRIPDGTTAQRPAGNNGEIRYNTTTDSAEAYIAGRWTTAVNERYLVVAASNEDTAITVGSGKLTFRMPYKAYITKVRASLKTASSSGTPTFDINENGTTILSTKISIDANEKTSTTAASAAVISDRNIADDAEIRIDIDTAGTGATGAKIAIYFYPIP
jgi:hypothetical protein